MSRGVILLERAMRWKNRFFRNIRDDAAVSRGHELSNFIAGLESMTDDDLAIIVAVATVVRVNMEDKGFLPQGLFFGNDMPPAADLGRYQIDIIKVVKQFNRRRQPTDAMATMVLAHSLRCLFTPELRAEGRTIWRELSRGFAAAEQALGDGEIKKGESFPRRVWRELEKIPLGLEPL